MDDPTFVLVHSPIVGPATWLPVADALRADGRRVVVPSLLDVARSAPPRWQAVISAIERGLPEVLAKHVILVGHSGAGPLLPVVSAHLDATVDAYVFVDASVPPLEGATTAASNSFLAVLEGLSDKGNLPPWSAWWGPGVMEKLVPDPTLRAAIEAELPRMPLSYFTESIPVPAGWADTPSAYLQFSAPYQDDAATALAHGWPVHRIVGQHLHLVVEPNAVAEAVVALAQQALIRAS
ncbi:MAG: hypothetical protein QOD72_2007 [Acidimicrobiaceae bacterium]|nr:hypothetical protein [Acidimicrobiaceae bacterium]